MHKEKIIREKESIWIAIESFIWLEVFIWGLIFKWDASFLIFFSVGAIVLSLFAMGSAKNREVFIFLFFIRLTIFFLFSLQARGRIIKSILYISELIPEIIPLELIFLRNTIAILVYIYSCSIAKNKEYGRNKRTISLIHLIVIIISIFWFIIGAYRTNIDTYSIKDERIAFCQPLLDEYNKLQLSSLQVKNIRFSEASGNEDYSIVATFGRVNDENIEYDKEKIIQCTDVFMKNNPNNELLKYEFDIYFEMETRGGYHLEIKYKNGKREDMEY